MELVHNAVAVKVRSGLNSELLSVEGLNRQKQVIDVLRPIVIFSMVSGRSLRVTFTFHSRPLEIAVLDRLEGPHIGGGKASVPIKNISLGMDPGALGVTTGLDSGVGQLAQLFNGLHLSGTHIGGGDDPRLVSILRKLLQFVHREPHAVPLGKGHQHVDAVGGDNLLFSSVCIWGPWMAPVNRPLWAMEVPGRLRPAAVLPTANRGSYSRKSARSYSALWSTLSVAMSASWVMFCMRSTI